MGKVYEIQVLARGSHGSDADPSLTSTASASTFVIDSVVVNGVSKPSSFFEASELSTLTAAIKAGVVNLIDKAVAAAAVITKGAGVGGGTGQFSVTGVSSSPTTVAEVWTVAVTNATPPSTWSVTGSVSGAKADATIGVPYDNGQIAFTINDTGTDPAVTDAFTITVTES